MESRSRDGSWASNSAMIPEYKKEVKLNELMKIYIADAGGRKHILQLAGILACWMAFQVSNNFWMAIWVTSGDVGNGKYFIVFIFSKPHTSTK